jgi:hypothetical protein
MPTIPLRRGGPHATRQQRRRPDAVHQRFFLRPKSGFNGPLLLKYPAYEAYYQNAGRWYRLFENYCTRLLTFESDPLAAIAGLAKEIQRQTNSSDKAGLWVEDIHTGLLWAVNGRGERAG